MLPPVCSSALVQAVPGLGLEQLHASTKTQRVACKTPCCGKNKIEMVNCSHAWSKLVNSVGVFVLNSAGGSAETLIKSHKLKALNHRKHATKDFLPQLSWAMFQTRNILNYRNALYFTRCSLSIVLLCNIG